MRQVVTLGANLVLVMTMTIWAGPRLHRRVCRPCVAGRLLQRARQEVRPFVPLLFLGWYLLMAWLAVDRDGPGVLRELRWPLIALSLVWAWWDFRHDEDDDDRWKRRRRRAAEAVRAVGGRLVVAPSH